METKSQNTDRVHVKGSDRVFDRMSQSKQSQESQRLAANISQRFQTQLQLNNPPPKLLSDLFICEDAGLTTNSKAKKGGFLAKLCGSKMDDQQHAKLTLHHAVLIKHEEGKTEFDSEWRKYVTDAEIQGIEAQVKRKYPPIGGGDTPSDPPGAKHTLYSISILLQPDPTNSAGTTSVSASSLTKKMRVRLSTWDSDIYVKWMKELQYASQWKVIRYYDLNEKIGEGLFATVFKSTCKKDRMTVAIKKIAKTHSNPKILLYVDREEQMMRVLNHKNIVRTLDVFDDPTHLYIVLEYMPGGMLFKVIAREKHFSEVQASSVMRQVGEGLYYLHERGIVHRDLKPDNMLCDRDTFPLTVKLADFGLANFVEDEFNAENNQDDQMTSMVGTPFYVAPEMVMKQKYGPPVDMWACGVLLYVMLSGRFPFLGFDQKEVLSKIKKAEFSFPAVDWKDISEGAKSVVMRLLSKDPNIRMTAKELLQHRWITQGEDLSADALASVKRETSLVRSSSFKGQENLLDWLGSAESKSKMFVQNVPSNVNATVEASVRMAEELKEQGIDLKREEEKTKKRVDALNEKIIGGGSPILSPDLLSPKGLAPSSP
eukprot:CAMPEP_0184698660 /NCGR_PEP_ID=MMETSP0313-20130426/5197_1 /TAXON_ID=2792 /ORGANISM="Porphyridium aerugineum, Strain SAG 1380-2" /LENGTH=597 /DNA_ID=CAMNT_0027157629 /DNA_START=47 /DNA_END=1840 /DNA_ORIENTATION=+